MKFPYALIAAAVLGLGFSGSAAVAGTEVGNGKTPPKLGTEVGNGRSPEMLAHELLGTEVGNG